MTLRRRGSRLVLSPTTSVFRRGQCMQAIVLLLALAVLLPAGRADAQAFTRRGSLTKLQLGPRNGGQAIAALPSNWLDYTAVALNRLEIGSNIEVSGNFA